MKRIELIGLFVLLLIVKVASIAYLSSLARCNKPNSPETFLATKGGDTFSYLDTMDNYMSCGDYYSEHAGVRSVAGRLPHYGIPYYLLRQLFDQATSYDIMVLLQLLLECLASMALVLQLFLWTNRRFIAYLSFGLLAISWHWTFFTGQLLPESFAVSFLIFGIYLFGEYQRTQSERYLLLVGLLFGLVTVLKPYMILFFGVIGIYFLFKEQLSCRNGWKQVVKKTIIVSIPLILLLSPWIVRNYMVLHRFVPFQENLMAGYNYTKSDLAVRKYMQAWGGNYITWDPYKAGCFFDYRVGYLSNCEFDLPDRVITTNVSKSEIVANRDFYRAHRGESEKYEKMIVDRFVRMTNEFREEHGFYYYVGSRLNLARQFIFNSGATFVPVFRNSSCNPEWAYYLKYIQGGIYHLVLIPGLIGLFLIATKTKIFFYSIVPLVLILLFPFILKGAELRMFMPAIPLLIFGFGFICHYFFEDRK